MSLPSSGFPPSRVIFQVCQQSRGAVGCSSQLSFTGTIGVFNEQDYLTALDDGVPYVAKNTAFVEGETVLVLDSEWRKLFRIGIPYFLLLGVESAA